jgi:hypothetical protein
MSVARVVRYRFFWHREGDLWRLGAPAGGVHQGEFCGDLHAAAAAAVDSGEEDVGANVLTISFTDSMLSKARRGIDVDDSLALPRPSRY